MTRFGAAQSARVLRDGELAGALERTERGAAFRYDAAYLERHRNDTGPLAGAIALHLPLQSEPHLVTGTNLHPFFAGLLPEGARLEALWRGVKSSAEDLLSLLAAAGADTIGDVGVVAEVGTSEATPMLDPARAKEASFRELLQRSLDYGQGGDRVLAPGAQDKISAAMISLPVNARSEAYILKLEPRGFPRIVENEAFMMAVARNAGLRTADSRVVHDRDGVSGLLVRRFDRIAAREAPSAPGRLHVEDGCQLLDRYPADKYAVSTTDLVRAIAEHSSTPILDVATLIRLVAFSYAIANGDLHAKNVSLLLSPDRASLTMSPAYDLLTTLPYGDTSMALMVEGRDKKLRRAHFVALGERLGVRHAATQMILDEVVRAVGSCIEHIGEIGFSSRQNAHLARTLRQRCRDLD
ncbi:MAG: HipA domain-containing protein [Polyangiaceae bacterium]|nr:HipA domain-containing protein [Polyangiaceae bacterium]